MAGPTVPGRGWIVETTAPWMETRPAARDPSRRRLGCVSPPGGVEMFQRLHAVTGGSDYGPRNRRPNISSRLWQILLEIHAATATAASQSPQRCPSAHAADRERQLPANTETTTPQQSVHSQAVTLHSRASITACPAAGGAGCCPVEPDPGSKRRSRLMRG